MKKLIFLPLILFVASCATKSAETADKNNRIEITPLIMNRVVLQDSNLLCNVYKNLIDADSAKIPMYKMEDYMSNKNMFMNSLQFNQLKTGLQYLINNPKSKVYDYAGGHALSSAEIKNIIFRCDSIMESSFDANGKETTTARFMCDSTSIFRDINMIDYYEAIYFNKETNMIEKEILGYTVKSFNERTKHFRGLFTVFRDEKAMKVVEKYDF